MKAVIIKNLSDDFHRLMKIQAARETITLKELIEKAVMEHIERYEKEHKKGR